MQVLQDRERAARAFAAARTLSYTRWWTSVSPWEKLSRATSIPASTRAWICSADSVAGPMVQTILALRMGRAYAFLIFVVGPHALAPAPRAGRFSTPVEGVD